MTNLPVFPGIQNLSELSRSSFLTTYRGEMDGTHIVVEVLTEDTDQNRNEFYRTTALQSRLSHPGMPPFQFADMFEGHPYRVREFVDGKPVSSLFTGGPLSKQRLVTTGRALALTLNALHARGMVHAEVHPHCLRVDSSGLIRFFDAGRGWPVARPLPKFEKSLALPYLAPEVEEGSPARTESDIFSLGAVLAALAVGKPAPRTGVTNEFLKQSPGDIPPSLRVLLRSMLDKDPSKRPEAKTVAACLTRVDQLDALLRLQSWKPEASASSYLGHHAYPMVGREKELATLMSLWQRAAKGKGLSVTILGPNGSGRRRLLEELRRGILRSGGAVVRHQLEAKSEQPTLIVNYSHKGKQGHNPDNPWLNVNFAETGPVPDQHVIELEPLAESDCVRVAEAYLASPLTQPLQEELFSRGPGLPDVLLQQLDDWCEEGALRPSAGRWIFNPDDSLPRSRDAQPKAESSNVSEIKIDYDEALRTIVELWSTSLEQDDPLVAALASFCKALKCERADLYQVVDNKSKYVCASSFGRHRVDHELMEQVLLKREPVWSGTKLLFPLHCGITFCGFMSLKWWDVGAPRFDTKLFQTLAMAASPIALTLGQTQLEDRRLKRITLALEDLLDATSEPSDVMSQLAAGLRRSLEFDILSAWIVRNGKVEKMFTDPPGKNEVDGSTHKEILFCAPYEPRQHKTDEDVFLSLPLYERGELLGGVIISRDPSIGFSETEVSWAATLARVGRSALSAARLSADSI